jgi:hypothetical protein
MAAQGFLNERGVPFLLDYEQYSRDMDSMLPVEGLDGNRDADHRGQIRTVAASGSRTDRSSVHPQNAGG